MNTHQAAFQAAEILPLIFLMDDTKIGSMTQDAMIEVLHVDKLSTQVSAFHRAFSGCQEEPDT